MSLDQSIIFKSGVELLSLIHKGELKCEDVVKVFLNQIEAQKEVNALITVTAGSALERAAAVDLKVSQNQPLQPLEGFPIILKDMICTKGVKTTAASKMLSEFVPSYSASLWQKLEGSGAILLGKANQDEFAMGSANEYSFYGACKNPWDLTRVAGGSSGGSAAAVSARLAPVSLGTDTGGSIRLPAHFCGVFGMKPTYGRISRSGVIAFASSLDQVGPFSNYVQDSALILEHMAGFDLKDSTMSSRPIPSWSKKIKDSVEGLTIGYVDSFFEEASPSIQNAFEQCRKLLEAGGAKLRPVKLEVLDALIASYYIISSAEASSNLSRYDGLRYGHRSDQSTKSAHAFFAANRGEGFGSEVKRRIMLGTFALSKGYAQAYYDKARLVRFMLKKELETLFSSYDLILTPVALESAVAFGRSAQKVSKTYTSDICTVMANLAGMPAASIPMAIDDQGLPVGLQFVAPHFQEQRLFDTGYFFEKNIKFYEKEPSCLVK